MPARVLLNPSQHPWFLDLCCSVLAMRTIAHDWQAAAVRGNWWAAGARAPLKPPRTRSPSTVHCTDESVDADGASDGADGLVEACETRRTVSTVQPLLHVQVDVDTCVSCLFKQRAPHASRSHAQTS